MSKDGEIFLHHDETFDRTTNVSGKVQDFNWSEISKINAGYKFYEKSQQKDKTTNFVRLVDALKMSEKLKFNLDLKQTGMAKKVVEIINSLNAKERVLVSSFSPKRLDEFLNVSKGEILTSGTFRENAIARFLPLQKEILRFKHSKPHLSGGGYKFIQKTSGFCKLNNLQLHVWTVNSIENFKTCLEIGCDGVITDEPILFRNYLNK